MSGYLIDTIARYPVKGFGPENLDGIKLFAGSCLPGDRRFAITHGASEFNFSNPQWISRGNFLCVARSPKLAGVNCRSAESNTNLVLSDKQHSIVIDPSSATLQSDAIAFLTESCGKPQAGPYKLVSLGDTQSLTDSPTKTVSLMNTASLLDFETKLGVSLDKQRFRGNVWFNGQEPREELDWIGTEVTIGDTRLKIVEAIIRCAAIEANTESGIRDVTAVSSLDRFYGDFHFGVLAEVVDCGHVSVGDTLSTSA